MLINIRVSSIYYSLHITINVYHISSHTHNKSVDEYFGFSKGNLPRLCAAQIKANHSKHWNSSFKNNIAYWEKQISFLKFEHLLL